MYDDITKSQAFVLFCQGVSFRKIAEVLSTHPGCEKITHSTIKSWSEVPDGNGRTWEDRKTECLALTDKIEKNVIVRNRAEILKETDTVLNSILDEIRGKNLEFKTKDAAIYAFKALAEWSEKIKDKEKRISIEDQVTMLLDAMNEIPEVAEALSKHWTEINEKFQKLAREMLKKKRDE